MMKILYDKHIEEYYILPFKDMVTDLRSVKKHVYEPGDVILVKSYGDTDQHIWKHFLKIIKYMDIPTFFINIETSNTTLEDDLNKLCEEIIPRDGKIKVSLTHGAPVVSQPYINNFDIPDTICPYPFVNVDIRNNGNITPCCVHIDNENKFNCNASKDSISNYLDSDGLKDLKDDFLNGNRPIGCQPCWTFEDQNVPSMRTKASTVMQDKVFEINYHSTSKDVFALDLKLGTTCNLKCRICGPNLSSSWYQEIKHNFPETDKLPLIKKMDWLIDNSNDFWKEITSHLHNIGYISMQGGEPFLDRKHYVLLEYLIKNNQTSTYIHYNTNGSIYPSELIEILNKFDRVGISFSIDNIAQKFDYERFGSNWDIVSTNLKKFSNLNRSKFTFDLHPTISVLNILDADDIKTLADELDFGIYFNRLDTPDYFNVLNIPAGKRNFVINRLNQSKHKIVTDLTTMLSSEVVYNLNQEFWLEINRIDKVRKENFVTTYPEMSALMRSDDRNL